MTQLTSTAEDDSRDNDQGKALNARPDDANYDVQPRWPEAKQLLPPSLPLPPALSSRIDQCCWPKYHGIFMPLRAICSAYASFTCQWHVKLEASPHKLAACALLLSVPRRMPQHLPTHPLQV